MINVKEFDEKFDKGEDIDEFLDLEKSLTLSQLLNNSITITLSEDLKKRVEDISKKLNLSIEGTIKVLVAKEVGVL